MKKINLILMLLAAFIILIPTNACAQRIKFSKSTIVPAAEGAVKVRKDKNNNYLIKVNIDNLAAPERLTPPRQAYVLWMITEDNMPKNIGKIKVATKFLSSKLKASFETVSSIKPLRIFITAENDASVQYTDYEVILTTNNF
ncbi:MAG TPA: hypothetical protein DEO54_07050 [Rikenellaceae bacterium]|nr:MAG: hypothetical protein A2X20_08005 [Bacteroidetes bacterium GWE2_40_15]HBG23772.1 hypothetical protein [Rikenellaceae bacterium]HBZ25980.1 hypothetical protein [Rikenellaceae bacterium]